MSRFLLAVGLVAVAATVAPSQPPLGKSPSLRAKLDAKPFDPKAKSVQLTDDEAKALVNDLADDDADKRLAALLRVRPGAPESVVVAVLGRLSDAYREPQASFDGASYDYVLRRAAVECVAHLGPPAAPVVLTFAQGKVNRRVREECVRLLGRLGHTADGEKWLRELLAADQNVAAVQNAAEAWGGSGAPLLRAVVAKPMANRIVRLSAMNALGKHGDPKADVKLLRPFLISNDWEFRAVAVMALGNLRDTESVPAFEKLARDPKEENHVRRKATERALVLLDKAAGDKLVLDVVKTADGLLMGEVAEQAAARKLTAAVPHLLAGLGDEHTHTREQADKALRALTGRPDGVGYDPQKGNADLWRAVAEKK